MLGFDDTGTGEPLVLIHGWAARRTIWHHIVPLLPGRRVIAIDLPGFGSSPPAGEGFDLEEVARAVWDGLPVEGPVTFVGHSLGAAVALTAAALEPARTHALVLCSPAGLRPVPLPALTGPAIGFLGQVAVDLRRAALPCASTPLGRRLLMGTSTADAGEVSEEDAIRMIDASDGATRTSEALQTVTSVDLVPLIKRAPTRLGVMWGDHDRLIPRAAIDAILGQRSDALLEVIPGGGHLPMMERPDAFAATLVDLLERLH